VARAKLVRLASRNLGDELVAHFFRLAAECLCLFGGVFANEQGRDSGPGLQPVGAAVDKTGVCLHLSITALPGVV